MIRRRHKFVMGLSSFIATTMLVWYFEYLSVATDRWHAFFSNPEPASISPSLQANFLYGAAIEDLPHPVDTLIEASKHRITSLLSDTADNISTAAAHYVTRRGRHPPPNFEHWFRFARERDCLIVEELFDQIYHDLNPFWALPASEIRQSARNSPNAIRVRNGKVAKSTSTFPFIDQYFQMFQKIAALLPDVDVPINEMDEPRVLLPWEDINEYLSKTKQRRSLDELPTIGNYPVLQDDAVVPYDYAWHHEGPFWNIARSGCHPESAARFAEIDKDFSSPPKFPTTWPEMTYKGFVTNWTVARDPCVHTQLRNLHGSFVEPISQATTRKLVPIFSGSKLSMNNDILLPPAVYFGTDERFSIGKRRVKWEKKRDEVMWRGSASGGRNTIKNWTRFHRHRLLSMLNGTQIRMALQYSDRMHLMAGQSGANESTIHDTSASSPIPPQNFPLHNQTLYPIRSFAQGLLPDWIQSLSNAAFTWLVCFPSTRDFGCDYTGQWYSRGKELPLHRMFDSKYLPDVDGNSFSGRYRAFLHSNSLPIKASVYSEWHDDRLIPWRHFVPMDNTFMDFWALLEYFVSHDDKAREIASEGSVWANQVLREEDMLVYAYRLMLEYARVSSDDREQMGWSPEF